MKHLGSALGLLWLVTACAGAQAADTKEKKPPPAVFVRTLAREELSDLLSYPVRVQSQVATSLRADIDGIVQRVGKSLGQKVRRGETVLSLKHTDPVFDYATVNVRAPVAGVVASLDVREGTQVSRGQVLGLLTDPTRIEARVEVPVNDLARLNRGLSGELRIPGRDEPVKVKIRALSPWVDPATGTASCDLEVGTALPPGLLGRVEFRVNRRKGISIPDDAVVYLGKETFVRVVEGGKARKMAVQLGAKTGDQVEILNGLQEGLVLIERTSRFLADGEAVTVQAQEKAPTSSSL